ncbi:hypothetical protein [Hymenobacter sp. GOD-10R]|uniref:hypothetical protein n=1 Tax=Hymenobacter sp. GOD-10R TaxID=3093922 RepID=UPI002D77A8C9|nr:hypothetical protein [Hymenobacter sp. GOD-10R]WRQ28771.1 hypothetical protein SD425_00645 [Hymenobacter sp. GOD-10R]
MKAFFAAASLTLAALAFGSAPAHAQQISINIGQPAPPPRVVVVHEVQPVRVYKAPKYKRRAVMLVPAGPAYYAPRDYGRGHGHGHGHGHGRH